MSSDDTVLICAPAAWKDHRRIGTVFGYNCVTCGGGVMVSLAGQRQLADFPATIILCLPCMRADLSEAKDVQMVPGAEEELRENERLRMIRGSNN